MGTLATLAPDQDGAAAQVQNFRHDASAHAPLIASSTSSNPKKGRQKRKASEGIRAMVAVPPSRSSKKRKNSMGGGGGGEEEEGDEDDDCDDDDDDGDDDDDDGDDGDDDGGGGNTEEDEVGVSTSSGNDKGSDSSSSEDDDEEDDDDDDDDDDDEGDNREFPDSTAFGRAFRKIMRKKVPETTFTEAMGPMLCAHKNLVAMKLEEMAVLKESKTERKRKKQEIREKGHTPIAVYPAAKDRELIKLATRGVVKLFNAVSKAQSVQEAAKVSKAAETKEVAKRSKTAFLATLQGGDTIASAEQKKTEDLNKKGNEQPPGWSALKDSFMLGKSKLKDWDKKQEDSDMEDLESSDDDSR